jgi:hypothetical protein
MNKLSKEKRTQLIAIGMGTVTVMALLWFGLISFQCTKLKSVAGKITAAQQEIEKDQKVQRQAPQIDAELKTATARLQTVEATMPSGDLFYWFISHLKQFNTPGYKVDMPQVGQPTVGEVPLLADYPYHEVSIAVGGTAYYSDFGRFVAEFENHFPYARLQNITVEPTGGATPDDKEKLSFRMDIVVLLKPTNS